MATNLRLRHDAEEAVRAEAERSGRSQQDVIRDAIDRQLGLVPVADAVNDYDVLIGSGAVRPPRTPYRRSAERIVLPDGVTTLDLLDHDERLLHDRLRR